MIELSNSKKTYLGKAVDGRNRWALDCSIGAIQFREKGGEWQDIDPSVEAADTEGFSVKFTQVPYLGRITNDSRRRIYPDRTNLDCWIEFQKPYASMGLPTRSDRWFYWNFPNAILGIRFDNTSVKFGFRLKNSSAPTSITIPFTTQGITRQGRFLYYTEDTLFEYAIGELRKPIATDANDETRECEVTFGTGEVTVSLDTTGLTFPIDIDPELDLQVGANLDDVHELESTGAVTDTTNIIHMASTTSAGRNWGAHRWTDVDIPEGATVDVAYAELYIYSAAYDDANVNLHFEKAMYPAQFTTNDDDVTGRTRTDASESWVADGVGAGGAAFYQTPSLVTPLQEVVTSYSPTALALIFRPNQDTLKRLYSTSHNSDPTKAAKLHIEWTAASNTILLQVAADLDDVHEEEDVGTVIDHANYVYHISDSSDTIRCWGAHRWASGSLPSQGDTIDICYVQLYIPTTAVDDIDGFWHFEKASAPAQFTAGVGNTDVTERTRTTASVTDDQDSVGLGWYQSPELKTALQEVIDNYSPTALALIFRPDQTEFKSFYSRSHNYDSTLAARIFIKWTPAIMLSLTDGLKAGDTPSQNMVAALSVLEGLKGGDSLSPVGALLLSDGIKLGDTPIPSLLAYLSLSDGLKTGDTSLAVPLLELADGIKAGDTSSILSILTLAEGLKLGETSDSPILRQYYNTGDNVPHAAFGSDIWIAQTFTPSVSHKILSVKLKLYREGSPGTINIGIKAVDGSGHPTGSDLCSGTTDGDTLTIDTSGEWREITLGSGCNLSADTKYAIVAKALSGNGTNLFEWRAEQNSPTYSGGCLEYTYNAGSSWDSYSNVDMMFEEYGAEQSPLLDLLASLSLTDGSKLGDVVSILAHLSLTDGIKLGDAFVLDLIVSIYYLTVADGTKFGDAASQSMIAGLSLTDGMKLGDTLNFLSTATLTITDGVKFGDTNLAELTGVGFYLSLTDGLKLGDTPLVSFLANLQLTDGTKLGDSDLVEILANLGITDGLKLGDESAVTITELIYWLTLTDGVKFGDAVDLDALMNLGVADGIKLGDVTLREIVGIAIILSDGFKLGDTSALSALMELTLLDGVKFSDYVSFLAKLVKLWLYTKTIHDIGLYTKPYHYVKIWTGEDSMTRRRDWQRGETVPIWAEVKDADGNLYDPDQGVKLTLYKPAGTVVSGIDGTAMTKDSTGIYVYYWNTADDEAVGWYKPKGHAQDGTGDTAKITFEFGAFLLQ